jgi:hypothetical protein
MVLPEDLRNDIYKLSINPFLLERQGEYEKAIDSHKKAIEVLSMAAEKFKKVFECAQD